MYVSERGIKMPPPPPVDPAGGARGEPTTLNFDQLLYQNTAKLGLDIKGKHLHPSIANTQVQDPYHNYKELHVRDNVC